MYELIVLGLVPGTQMQISFLGWFVLCAALIAALFCWRLRRSRLLRSWLLAVHVSYIIRRSNAALMLYNFSHPSAE